MTSRRLILGASFDAIAIDSSRILLAHCVAALIVAVALWIRIGPEYFSGAAGFRVGGPVLYGTLVAWIPYVFSWALARRYLAGRGTVGRFILCVAVVALASSAAFAGLMGSPTYPAVAVSLIAAAVLVLGLLACMLLRDPVPPSNKSLERTRDR